MSATILDGKQLASKCKEQFRLEAAALPRRPGLAVIIVGENSASRVYVNSKKADCEECGFLSEEYALPEDTSQEDLIELIETLNAREAIDGILVQLPLPKGIDEEAVLRAISPEKDVDGFHPMNMGALLIGKNAFVPCTPAGIMEMLEAYNIDPAGKHCVIVGRSNSVGKPMALLLMQKNGTVTVCHSKTKNLEEICRSADILVAAVGKVGIITGDMIQPGAVVIDVAMNRNEEGKLCGDVLYHEALSKASAITPVPGGVGPMTRALLMKNTLKAARQHLGLNND